VFGIAGQFLVERGARRACEFRRWRFHHRQNRPVPVETLVELNVALAPIEIGRNLRVDIGVDLELSRSIKARHYRKDECDQDSGGGKPCAGFDNRNNYTCQHIYSF
jgi:hypothetical protein